MIHIKEAKLGRKLKPKEIFKIGWGNMRFFKINDLPLIPFER